MKMSLKMTLVIYILHIYKYEYVCIHALRIYMYKYLYCGNV